MGKFKTSRMIASQSWALLKQDKEMVLFPILSAVTSLVAFVLLFSIFYFQVGDVLVSNTTSAKENIDGIRYLFLFILYIISHFIINFFQSGIFVVAHARFNNQNLGFSDGIRISFGKVGKIFIWSLISATVGIVLDFISEKSKLIGKIVVVIFGTAWQIMTYFSLPSLIIGNTTILGSFKESAQLIKKVWGETFIVNIGAGFYFAGIIMVGFISALLITIAIPKLILVCALLFLILLVLVVIISSTLNTIFKLVIYEYARTGVVPNGFSPELIQSAIKSNPIEQVVTTPNPQM